MVQIEEGDPDDHWNIMQLYETSELTNLIKFGIIVI